MEYEKVHLVKRKTAKHGVFYIAALPYKDPAIKGYRKMIILQDEYGNRTANAAKARVLLQNLKEKDLKEKEKGVSVKEYFLNFWTNKSEYVKSRQVEGKPLTQQYIDQCHSLILHYFLPWCKENKIYSLSQLKRSVFKKFRNDCILEGRSAIQVNKCKLALSTALREAVDNELIENNPIAGLRMAVQPKSKRQAYTVEELKSLFSVEWKNDRAKTAAMTAAYLGCRLGEIQGLLWENVRLEEGTLDIVTQWIPSCGVGLKSPKRDSFRYNLIIPSALLHRFVAMKATAKSIYVFFGKSKSVPITRQYLNDCLRCAKEKANIVRPGLTFHSFRHSWVSMSAESVGLETASAMIGHSNIDITKRYRHISVEAQRKAVKAVSEILG